MKKKKTKHKDWSWLLFLYWNIPDFVSSWSKLYGSHSRIRGSGWKAESFLLCWNKNVVTGTESSLKEGPERVEGGDEENDNRKLSGCYHRRLESESWDCQCWGVMFLEGSHTWSCSDEGKLQLKLQFCICVEYGLNIPNVRPNHPMEELEVFVCLKPGISLDFSWTFWICPWDAACKNV